MGSGIQKRWRESFGTQSDYTQDYPEETPIWIKERVITKRKKTKLCALKLHWRLAKEGLVVPVRTIGKILKQEGFTRKYRVKKMKYKYIRAERQPGEIVEIDVKYVPGKIAGRRYFQYTAIDVASRWRHLEIYDEQTNHHSICFLKEVMRRFDYPIAAIKTDNHATFTNRYNGSYKREDLSPRQMHALDQSVLHTTSYTISLIRVNPLKMVLLKEVTVKIRRSSMNKTDSKICDLERKLKRILTKQLIPGERLQVNRQASTNKENSKYIQEPQLIIMIGWSVIVPNLFI